MIEKRHTFVIEHVSEQEQQTFRGQFTSKKLSMMDRSKINVRKAQLNGGMYAVRDDEGRPTGLGIDEETEYLNYMIAFLEVVLIDKPVWWKMEDLSDDDLVLKVFQEAMKFENSFRKSKTNDGSVGSSAGSSEAQYTETNAGSPIKKMVDKEVLASLD